MRKKRNSFLTFCFSMIPGAGQMFLGFMKTGISLMTAFVLVIFLAAWLNIGLLTLILPVLWFYSFFDSMNRLAASDEVFVTMEDNFLFSLDKIVGFGDAFQKRNLIAGILFVLFGVYLMWINILNRLWNYIPHPVYDAVSAITRVAPQMILGVLIVTIGVRLILNKKKEG